MTSKDSFRHDLNAINLHMKIIEVEMQATENSFKRIKESISYIREVADEIHSEVIEHLPNNDIKDKEEITSGGNR